MGELVELKRSYSDRKKLVESAYNECSTDSSCSSRGSTSSSERISRVRYNEKMSTVKKFYSHEFDVDQLSSATTYVRHLSKFEKNSRKSKSTTARSRSWSPCPDRKHTSKSSTQSSSTSDDQSTDSDSLQRESKIDILTRALHYLKTGKWSKDDKREEKSMKKNPKRILRDPVTYTYIKGPSGLPTQRVPRGHSRCDLFATNSSYYRYEIQRIINP